MTSLVRTKGADLMLYLLKRKEKPPSRAVTSETLMMYYITRVLTLRFLGLRRPVRTTSSGYFICGVWFGTPQLCSPPFSLSWIRTSL
jgi:hypothetical protein